jgi:hypothetical protein
MILMKLKQRRSHEQNRAQTHALKDALCRSLISWWTPIDLSNYLSLITIRQLNYIHPIPNPSMYLFFIIQLLSSSMELPLSPLRYRSYELAAYGFIYPTWKLLFLLTKPFFFFSVIFHFNTMGFLSTNFIHIYTQDFKEEKRKKRSFIFHFATYWDHCLSSRI